MSNDKYGIQLFDLHNQFVEDAYNAYANSIRQLFSGDLSTENKYIDYVPTFIIYYRNIQVCHVIQAIPKLWKDLWEKRIIYIELKKIK